MLAQISIKDFAIIDQITVNFQEGLTVLTGETGAGKSIIIDAIQLLAGARASVEFVRHDADQASIEGIFFIENDSHPVKNVISQLDLPEDEEGSVILERFITSKGKSICRVNGKLVTLGILKEVGQKLIDIHSQHETQSLMNPEKHVELLDYFNGQKIDSAKQSYLEVFNEWSTIQKRYKDLSENEQEVAQRVDLLKFQLNELQEAQLEVDEDEQLEEERNQLANFEKIFEGLQATYYSLYGENKGLDFLSNAMTSLEMLEDVDDSLQSLSEQMKSAYFTIEELSFDLRNRLDSLEYQPDRLNEIESRLNELNRLKRKYGQSLKELVDLMISMEEELEQLENKDTHLHALEKQIKELTEDALMEAQNLHEIRVKTSSELKDSIHKELKDLYLDKAMFDVEFSRASGNVNWKDESIRLMKNGIDQIQFLISTNPGEPVKPLHKVASGGEISRIMLALKSIFSQHQGITSVIFDEVDTGVSGRVAQSIAQKIQEISKGSQVLCISHLPQVAAMADQHLLIEKDQDLNQTKTSVKKLEKEQSVEEIGRMISGSELTDATKKHALELIEQANNQKAKG